MRLEYLAVFIIALLCIWPAAADGPVTNVTTAVPAETPSVVPSPAETAAPLPTTHEIIPATQATTAPTEALTTAPPKLPQALAAVETTAGIPVTTIPLPPHEQDQGQDAALDIPQNPGLGVGEPTVTTGSPGETIPPAADGQKKDRYDYGDATLTCKNVWTSETIGEVQVKCYYNYRYDSRDWKGPY